MKIVKYLFIILIISVFVACSINTDKRYFNGTITIIDDSKIPIEKLIASKEIDFEDHFSRDFYVYDSLILFYNMVTNKCFFTICNLKDKTFIGDFCVLGHGPNESLGVPFIYSFYKQDNCLKTDQIAANNRDFRVWNITKSIENKITVYDTIIPHDSDVAMLNYRSYHRLDDDELFTYSNGVYLTEDKSTATLPTHLRRRIYNKEKIQDYNIFIESIKGDEENFTESISYFDSYDCIKPDRTNIVQGMVYLPQINILNLATGKCIGSRLKNSPGFSVFENNLPPTNCYACVQANDDFIYALYYGTPVSGSVKTNIPRMIHIFDWNGNLIKKLESDQALCWMWLDNVNNILYASAYKQETIFCYDLNKI